MMSGSAGRSDGLLPSLPSMLLMLPTPNLDCGCKQSKKRPYQTFAFKQIDKGHFEKLPPHDCSVRWHVPCVPALLTAWLKLSSWHATQYGALHWDLATVGKYSRGRTERPLCVCVRLLNSIMDTGKKNSFIYNCFCCHYYSYEYITLHT